MPRKKIPNNIQIEVLTKSKRRCALCCGINNDCSEKRGQIAHINKNNSDNEFDNLVWLCFEHHDLYDSQTSQSKNYQSKEVKYYRNKLYSNNTQNSLKMSSKNIKDIDTLKQFIYFMREYNISLLDLEYMVESLPSSINRSFLSFNSFFDNFKKDNRDRYPFNDNQLNIVFDIFVDKYIKLIHKITDYSINNNNRQYINFIHINNSNQMQMNKQYLSYENISSLNNEIELLKNDFINSYLNLINFLKDSYPEIDLR